MRVYLHFGVCVLGLVGLALGSLEPRVLQEQQLPHLTRTAPAFRYGVVPETRKAAALPSTGYGSPEGPQDKEQGQRSTRQRIPGFQGGFPGGYPGGFPGGQLQTQYPPQPYDFDYKVNDEYGNDFGHQESNDGRVTRGSYSVLLPDGRRQIVQYEADEAGYRPSVTYERVGAPVTPYGNPRPGRGQAPYF